MANLENFNNLPGEIKLRILSFLPHQTLFSFKTLNKEYRDLITNTGFQTNKIFNSYQDFIQKFPEILIQFIKTASECPLDFAYSYLTLRGHPENVIVLRAELSPSKKEHLIEGLNQNMRIYVRAKAVNNNSSSSFTSQKTSKEINLSNIFQGLRLLETSQISDIYQTQLTNPDFIRLLRSIKVCQRLVVREKDENHPMADIDHIPGPEVIELFSTNLLFSQDPNVNNINNFINSNGIIDYDAINRRFTTSPMKTVLLDSEKAIPILHGYLESGLVLELHNILFPVIETFEYNTKSKINDNDNNNEKNKSYRFIKRTIRLQPLKQIESYDIINIKNLNSNANQKTISKLQNFVQNLFSYICTCN